jgi:hypothetical protein
MTSERLAIAEIRYGDDGQRCRKNVDWHADQEAREPVVSAPRFDAPNSLPRYADRPRISLQDRVVACGLNESSVDLTLWTVVEVADHLDVEVLARPDAFRVDGLVFGNRRTDAGSPRASSQAATTR